MTLSEMKVGEKKKVVFVHNNIKGIKKIKSMGLVAGVEIKMIRKSPFDGPIEIYLRGYYMAIRVEHAKKIIVE